MTPQWEGARLFLAKFKPLIMDGSLVLKCHLKLPVLNDAFKYYFFKLPMDSKMYLKNFLFNVAF
jgi:hypothetical protein